MAKTLLEGIILTWGLLLELHDESTIALDNFQMLLVKSSLQHFCCAHQPQSSGQKERTNVCACVLGCSVMSNLPGPSVHGIFQARILERVAISSSRASSRPTSNQHPLGQLHRQADSLPLEPPGKPHSAMRLPERGSIPEKAPNRIEYNFPLIYTQTTILESSVLNNIVPKIKTFDIKCEIN